MGVRVCVCSVSYLQQAQGMRRIILSSVASPIVQYISTLSHKRHDFE